MTPIRRNLTLLGGAGLSGLGIAGAAACRMAPAFWNQLMADRERSIAPAIHRPTPRLWPNHGLHAAWLGHSTVLLKLDGFTLITDPLLSSHAGVDLRITQIGMKRLIEAAFNPGELPPLDLILLSHAHFDHLDTRPLRALESKQTEVIMAKSTSDLIRADQYKRVTELSWGESLRIGPLEIRAQEVNHWGARLLTVTYRGYNGYVLETSQRRVLFAGDTAQTDAFRSLKSRRGIDLAIMPVGAYNPWIHAHCTPEQALRMGLDAGATQFLPVHHQTFRLSREPLTEPIERFQAAAHQAQVPVVVHSVGQQVSWSG